MIHKKSNKREKKLPIIITNDIVWIMKEELVTLKISKSMMDMIDEYRGYDSKRRFVARLLEEYSERDSVKKSSMPEVLNEVKKTVDLQKDMITVLVGMVADLATGKQINNIEKLLEDFKK